MRIQVITQLHAFSIRPFSLFAKFSSSSSLFWLSSFFLPALHLCCAFRALSTQLSQFLAAHATNHKKKDLKVDKLPKKEKRRLSRISAVDNGFRSFALPRSGEFDLPGVSIWTLLHGPQETEEEGGRLEGVRGAYAWCESKETAYDRTPRAPLFLREKRR